MIGPKQIDNEKNTWVMAEYHTFEWIEGSGYRIFKKKLILFSPLDLVVD